jgi:hypothetical protein
MESIHYKSVMFYSTGPRDSFNKTFFVYIYLFIFVRYSFSQKRSIMQTLIKWSSLQKGLNRFTLKTFYEIDSIGKYYKTFYSHNLRFS